MFQLVCQPGRGTVGQVQERLVRVPRVQSPTEKTNAQFKTPSYDTHDARWNSALEAPTRFSGFRETFCSIFAPCGAARMNPNDLEDNRYEHDDGKWVWR